MFNDLDPKELEKRRLTEILENEINELFIKSCDYAVAKDFDSVHKTWEEIDRRQDFLHELYPYKYLSSEQLKREARKKSVPSYAEPASLYSDKRRGINKLIMKIFLCAAGIILLIFFLAK